MPFPVPNPSTSESSDAQRDERKRQASPPSAFFAQSQAVLTAVKYFEGLHSGYPGAARKHMNRICGAMFVQLMAAFEFTTKDFIAQTLDATHIYDDDVKGWSWLQIDVAAVLSTREGLGRLGAVLVHPLPQWQVPETVNERYQDVFKRQPIRRLEIQPLRDLWIVRHSVAHNAGFVTQPDARRLRSAELREKQVSIDVDFLQEAIDFLRAVVARLDTVIGASLLERFFREGASGVWEQDRETYARLKLLTTYVRSRPTELPEIEESRYAADLATYTERNDGEGA